MTDTWKEAQEHEATYWQNCLGMRAWGEFTKQELYGREMGLIEDYGDNGELDMHGLSVLDVGGGPVSMTLRCYNAGRLVVVDPCQWPKSVHRRYRNYGIEFVQARGEELDSVFEGTDTKFPEVWMINVLQHVENPSLVLQQAMNRVSADGKLRIFDWLYIPSDECHPHVLTPELILNGLSGARILKMATPRLREYWSDATAFVGQFQP